MALAISGAAKMAGAIVGVLIGAAFLMLHAMMRIGQGAPGWVSNPKGARKESPDGVKHRPQPPDSASIDLMPGEAQARQVPVREAANGLHPAESQDPAL
jgi:hypothetical protein